MELIDKAAVVAEIYRLWDFANDRWEIEDVKGIDKFLDKLIPYINSIEVKEVDLDKSLTSFMSRYAYENGGEYPSAIDIAEHFYELGIKSQKGE